MEWIGSGRTILGPLRDLEPLTLTCDISYIFEFVFPHVLGLPRPLEAGMKQTPAVITPSPPAHSWRNRVAQFRPPRPRVLRSDDAVWCVSVYDLMRRSAAWRSCRPFPPALSLITQPQGKLQPRFQIPNVRNWSAPRPILKMGEIERVRFDDAVPGFWWGSADPRVRGTVPSAP